MKLFRSQLIKKTFLSYMALLCLCLILFAVFTFRDIQRKARQELEDDCLRSARAMAAAIDQNFTRIQSTAMKLSQFPWVWRFSVTEKSFEEEFLPNRRREIVSELQVMVENDNLLQNLTLFFPRKDMVISSKGWFDTDRYLAMVKSDLPEMREAVMARNNFDVVYLDREVMAKNPVIWMLDTMDYGTPPRIQLAFSFDKNILISWASDISFSQLCSLTLYSGEGTPLVTISGPRAQSATGFGRTVVNAENFGWYYEITYDPSLHELPLDNLLSWGWLFIIAMLVGPFAAWILTWISYRPLQSLLDRIGQSKSRGTDNEYRLLEETFSRLIRDNESLQTQISEYGEFVQHDLSMRLLKGYFDRSTLSRELSYYGIDYTEDNRFCVLIVSVPGVEELQLQEGALDSRMMSALLLRKVLEQGPYQSRLIQVLDEDMVVILSDQKEPLEETSLDAYLEQLRDASALSPEIWRGGIEPRIIGISKSYHTARERYMAASLSASSPEEERSFPASFYYPTDWEIQLINGVKAGKRELVVRILTELRQENDSRSLDVPALSALFTSLEDTVLRLSTELSAGEALPARPAGDGDACWQWVKDCLMQLCCRMEQSKSAAQDIGIQVLNYVQQNFESPNLSLKEIAQELGISLSTASRAFKNATQMNFYDYTCRLRMEKVKRLMAEGVLSVRDLCRQVGYENEYSLRRTFQRYEGISITEYREKMKREREA